MSTDVENRPGRPAEPPQKRPQETRASRSAERNDSRFADWKSSWRIALKMARRDLRRHKGRSAVVALMVGVPMLILSWLATVGGGFVGMTSPAQMMGNAVALVSGPLPHQVLQTGSDMNFGDRYDQSNPDQPVQLEALPIPGFSPEGSAADNVAALGALLGGTVTPVAEPSVRVKVGDRNVLMQTLALDGSKDTFGGKVELVSGRWPSGTGEALVSEPGIRNGLPRSGTLEVVTADGTTTVTVVGIGTGVTRWGQVPHLISAEPLVATPDVTDPWSREWLLTGTDMPFTKIHELGAYGLGIQSAELVANPIPRDQLPPEVQQGTGYTEYSSGSMWLVAAAIILAIIIALLVAPAFAVSAGRQRHTLALAASNGATTRQLRRTVLAQALILGALAAVVGSLLGVGIAAGWAWRQSQSATDVYLPIVRIPWLIVAGLTLIAVAAAVAAALLPARRLGRLDIMGVLKGQSVSPPPSRILPILGLVLMVGGAAGVLYGARQTYQGDYYVTFGAIPLVIGALFLVPTALVIAGRLSAGLPVPLRMATRDAARQRTRSVPTVAAVMAGVAALTIGLIAGSSDNKENLETYLPQTIMGQGRLHAYNPMDIDPALAVVREVLPDAQIAPVVSIGEFWEPVEDMVPFAVLTTAGCTAEQAVYDDEWVTSRQAEFDAAADKEGFGFGDPPCPAVGGPMGYNGNLIALPAAEIISRFELTDAQAAQVREGAAVVPSSSKLTGESITAWSGSYKFDEADSRPTDITVTGERTLALITAPATAAKTGQLPDMVGAYVPLELAESEEWPKSQDTGHSFFVNAGDGDEISAEDEKLINERLDNAGFSIERGFQDQMTMFLAIVVAAVAFILLVIILTSTALSMAEQRRDDSTLAAVGATRGTRRAMAAAQGFTAAAIGAVLGLIVGIAPGIAFAYPLTRSFPDGASFTADGSLAGDTTMVGPFIEIPYGFLAILVIGVPVLASLISALAVRRAPVVTRRAD